MVSIRSRRARAITPRTRDTTFNSVVEMLNNPKGKQAKKSASKAKQARRVPTPSPPGESGDEQLEDICPLSTKRRKELICYKRVVDVSNRHWNLPAGVVESRSHEV